MAVRIAGRARANNVRRTAAERSKKGWNASAASSGAATKMAERCACTAIQASPAATAVCQIGDDHVSIKAIAVAILINAAATGGFQITDEMAISNGADAISRHIASARPQCTRRESATSSQVSASDCSSATNTPPACGRLSMKGPSVTRPSHSSQ